MHNICVQINLHGYMSVIYAFVSVPSDDNECDNSSPCEQNCNNTIGSYSCSCDEGYSLATDLHGCLGI